MAKKITPPKVKTDSTRVAKPVVNTTPDPLLVARFKRKQAEAKADKHHAAQKKKLEAKRVAIYKMVDEKIAGFKKNKKK